MKNDNGSISQETAIRLLMQNTKDAEIHEMESANYLDEYGNYVFLTDMVANEPNMVYGSAEGYNCICKLEAAVQG